MSCNNILPLGLNVGWLAKNAPQFFLWKSITIWNNVCPKKKKTVKRPEHISKLAWGACFWIVEEGQNWDCKYKLLAVRSGNVQLHSLKKSHPQKSEHISWELNHYQSDYQFQWCENKSSVPINSIRPLLLQLLHCLEPHELSLHLIRQHKKGIWKPAKHCQWDWNFKQLQVIFDGILLLLKLRIKENVVSLLMSYFLSKPNY